MTVLKIKQYISSICQKAGGLPSDFIFDVEVPPQEQMGDLSVSCFRAAKELKKSPQNIAENIAENIKEDDLIEKIENVGPYINFYFNHNWFKEICGEIIDRGLDYGQKENVNESVVIEFSSPNTNKPQHLGHLRNNF